MGVAIAQTITNTATPMPAIKMVNGQPKWNELDAIISDYKPIKPSLVFRIQRINKL